MKPLPALVALTALGCAALVAFLLLDHHWPAVAAKLLASSAFVAIAVIAGAAQSAYGRLVLLGLVLSWFGDAFLTGQSQSAFLAGLGAFLLAHVAYISGFVVRGISPRWTAVATLPVLAIALVVSGWLAPYLPPELELPVRLYIAVISVMLMAAIGTRGLGASAYIVSGAVLFFLSDLSVAALRLAESEFPTYVWGLPLYYAGQVCFALSTSQSRSH